MAARKASARPRRLTPRTIEALTPHAPDPDGCQHPAWDTRGNERPGRVWCPDCKGTPKIREAFDARLRAVLLELAEAAP